MVQVAINAYLLLPAVLGLAIFVYAVTRPPDRIQLATIAMFGCTLAYAGVAYELTSHPGSSLAAAVALGLYALALYVATGVLAFAFKRWAWLLCLAGFGLHILSGLIATPNAMQSGAKAIAVMGVYLFTGAVGLWALLHRGTLAAVAQKREAEA